MARLKSILLLVFGLLVLLLVVAYFVASSYVDSKSRQVVRAWPSVRSGSGCA